MNDEIEQKDIAVNESEKLTAPDLIDKIDPKVLTEDIKSDENEFINRTYTKGHLIETVTDEEI